MRSLHGMVMAAAAWLVVACGGGESPAPHPAIAAFDADKTAFLVGESAQLTPVFSGGSGRIVPDIGPVRSGVAVATPPLEGDVTYRLLVEADGQPAASRSLRLPVRHRDRFIAAGHFPTVAHSALELPDGAVLIVGGWRGGSVKSAAIDRFDPVTRSFARVGEMATGRAWSRPVLLADGQVLIVGGETTAASGVRYELFDPRTGRVTPAGVPVTHRLGHTATRLPDGRVLIAGGAMSATAEIWDPATRSARLVAARMANPREWHTATLLADGRVLLVGGYTNAARYWLAEAFDPATERFTPLGAPLQAPGVDTLAWHWAQRLADGQVLIVGGERLNPSVDDAGRPTAAVLRFDPSSSTFAPQPDLLAPRTLIAGAALPDDRLLVFGGANADSPGLATGERYRPGQPPASTAPLDVARVLHTVSRLPGGRLLVVGGSTPDGEFATAALIYD
jgi:hypothetical protein